LRVPVAFEPEIPVRRRQAALGITAAVAGLEQAEREVVYAVTRTYLTVLYARAQERVARSVVERLSVTLDAAKLQLEAGARNVAASDVSRTIVYQRLAETKQIQAAQGVKRALAALKEALGLGGATSFDVPAEELPVPSSRPDRDEVTALALARRGEIIRASLFAEVVCLEIEAQASSPHRKMETFAAGSDIHSDLVPQGMRNNEYQPGAVAPEMPGLLAGTRPERIRHASSLYARAQAVTEVTRNLIALEAEDAYLRWEEAALQVPKAREATQQGDKMADDLNKDFTSGLKARVEDVITARVTASQAQSQYNEFLYRQLLALADLERITAGGFCAGLADLGAPRARLGPAVGLEAR
jgi:outer membrane protein TolC